MGRYLGFVLSDNLQWAAKRFYNNINLPEAEKIECISSIDNEYVPMFNCCLYLKNGDHSFKSLKQNVDWERTIESWHITRFPLDIVIIEGNCYTSWHWPKGAIPFSAFCFATIQECISNDWGGDYAHIVSVRA